MNKQMTVFGNSFEITLPTGAEFLAIQRLKSQFINDNPLGLSQSGVDGQLTYLVSEVLATFTQIPVCKPLQEFLKINSLLEIEFDRLVELIVAYTEQYRPWLDSTISKLISTNESGKEKSEMEEIKS